MANADGQIILGLNISATAANIQSGLNSILNSTKTKQIVLKTAIEKAQTEKSIESLVSNLSKKTVKLGVEINAKDVQGILAQQQKIASTQANLNRQMQEYRKIAKDIGVTLNKNTWNSFNHAIKTEDFAKAREIIKSAKQQIDQYNNSIKKMNSDTSVSGSVSSIVEKFRQLNTVSGETKQKISQLKAALTRFENADSEQKKLRAYESLKLRLAELANEYQKLSSIEKTAVGNIPKTLENIASKSIELKVAVDSSGISGSGITGLSSNLDELRLRAETLQQKLANLDPSNANAVKKLQQEVAKLDNEFKKVEKDAKIFEDVNSIATFTASIEKAKQKVEEYGQKYSAIKSRPDLVQELERLKISANNISTPSQLKQWNAEFATFDTKVRQAGVHCKSFGDILKTAFSNFAQFFSASRIIYEVIDSIKKMVTAVKELDSAMVELKKVTDAPESDFAAFFERSKQSAIDYATTMKDIINSTADFSRLGFTFKESEQLAKTASVYNTVGDIDNIEKASQSIISTMKAFNIETENSISIVDKFNEVGNNFAISSEGIGDAFTRSASSMAAANNTIDQTIALITAANTVVQDADSVGTAFKTISMRIRGATTELEEAGLETDGMAESTAKLREEIMALSGVDIMLDENTFKSTYQIMDELAAKWADLTDIQQASITELIAGKRQGNIVSSLMENFDIARAALETSLNSSGSAMKEFEIQLDSVESKSKQFKAAFEALSTSIVNSDLLKGLIDTGTTLLTVFDSLIEKLGGFGNTITIIGLAIATLNFKGTVNLFTSIFNSLKTGFGIIPKIVSGFGNLKAAWDLGKSAGGGFITTLKGTSSALIGTASAASVATAAIMAIVAVIAIAVMSYQNYKRAMEEARQKTLEETNAIVDNANQLRSAYVSYMQYANKASLTTGEEEAFKSAIDQVTKSLGDKASALEGVTAGTQGYTQAMKDAAQEELKSALTAAKQAKKAAQDNLKEATWSDWSGSKITIDLSGRTAIPEFVSAYEEVERIMKDFMDDGTYGKELEPIGFDKNKQDYDAIVDYYYKLLELQGNLADAGNMENDIYENANKITGNLKDTVSDYLEKKYEELSLTYQLNNGIPTTLEEFQKYRDYLNTELSGDFMFDDGNDQLSKIIDGYLSTTEVYKSYISKLGDVNKTLSSVDTAISKVKNDFSNKVNNLKKEASDLGVDLSQTVFGNIDTNNRQILQWTDENIAKYKSALESWGHSVEDLKGDISTVLGTSTEFDGVEIAFSPMLQTENGAVLLDQNTVYKYINNLIKSAGEGWTTEDLLRLDTTGLEIDGQLIKGLLADIGETAKKTGEAMHFTGTNGAVKKAEKELQDFNNWVDNLSEKDKEIVYNISLAKETAEWSLKDWTSELENLKTNTHALDILKAKVEAINDVARGTISFDFNTESTGIDNIQSAIGESISGIGLTASAMAKVQERYSELAGYNSSELFEKTANGIHLNADALRELEAEYEAVNKTYLDTALDEQVERYNKLTEEISKCTDVQERAKLIAQQESLGKQIEQTSLLAAQYDGLTSAYQRWIDAQSGGEEGDMYDNISSGMKDVKELFDAGLVGTNEFRAAVQLMSNEDLSTAPIDKLVSAYQAGYGDMKRYFTEGQSGCIAFLSDISRLNSEWAKMNSDGSWEINFGVGNDEEIAKKLGISVEAVQAIMRKLSDYGFEIDLDSVYDDLAMLENKFVSANEKLKELGATDVDFNLNTENVDNVIQQIETAKGVFKNFTNEDGTVNLALEGAAEAQLLLTALIQKKQELCMPDVMKVDTSNAQSDVENIIKLLQDFQTANNNLEIATEIGLDTTEAQSNVDSALSAISESNPEILASLGIDATSAETLSATISALTPEVMVKAGIDASLVEGYQQAEHNAEGTVTWDNDTTKVDDWIVQKHNADGTVYWDNDTKNVKTHFTATGTIKWSGEGEARGTAFAQGSWGASKSGIALGGELGQELIVRNGKFFTIGDEGAEFFQYQKDDIIFNAEQTKQIFEKGKISSGNRRGRALVEGTAFSGGTGRFYNSGKVVTTKYVAPTDSSISPTPSTTSKPATAKTDEETEFERQYKYHQHLLAMDRETVQEYLDWLVVAYKEAYNAGQMELDDFYKYEEEVYEKSKSLFDDLIKDSEHQISLWENQGGNEQNIINEYKEMQKAAHEQAEYYRTLGLSEENDKIQELQKLWWDCEKNIAKVITDTCDKTVSSIENSIDLAKRHMDDFVTVYDDGSAEEFSESIVSKYKDIQSELHEAAEELRALGYSEDSAEIQDLQKQWWDAEEAKNDSLREIFDRRLELSEDYIERSKLLGWENGDTEIKARERILNWMSSDYYRSLFESEEEWQKAYLEQLEGYNDAVMSTIDKIHSDYSDAIDKINKEIDKQITREKALLDVKTKQYDAINRLTEAQHEADKAIADSRIAKAYLSDREYDLIYNEEDYVAVSKVIDDIDEDISLLTKNFNRQIENAYANGQEYLIENITAEYERQVELKMQELAIAQAELEVTKKQTELNNVLAERNIRQLVERNGKLEWEWVADTDKVRAATEALSDAEYQYEKAKDEKQQQINLNRMQENIDDFTDEQARNNKLVEQLGDTIDNIKKTIDDIENPIEGLTIDVKNLKEKGVVNFSKAIDSMVAKLGSVAINSASTAKQTTQSGFSSNSYSYGSGGGSSSRVTYDSSIDYMAQAQSAIKRGDDKAAANYLAKRDAKIDGEGLSYKKESLSDVKKKMGYASGTTHATKGWHEVDENGGETYITRDGKFHNFEGGEYVFDTEKTKTLYDLASKMTALSDGSLPLPVSKNNVPNSLSILQDQNNGGKGNSYSFGDIVVNNPADYNSFVKQLTNTIKKKTI